MSEHKCNDKTPLVDAALAHQGDTHTDVTIRLMNLTRVARDLEIRLRQTLSASKRMVNAGIKNEYEIEQILGKALGYPWFKDDQKNFPGATEEHGVCVGEHVAVMLATEAAERIKDGDTIVERLHRIVKRDAQLRRDIDAALNVTPEERQAETGAGLQGAVALLIKNIEKLTKERDEALARPSQHEGAHATCWAEVERLQAALAQAQTDAKRLNDLINTPQTNDFMEAIRFEAAHQQERWGSDHDAGKEPQDWFWLLGYLSGKALHAFTLGDLAKGRHHIISSAASLLNWHRHVSGEMSAMRPGIKPPDQAMQDTGTKK